MNLSEQMAQCVMGHDGLATADVPIWLLDLWVGEARCLEKRPTSMTQAFVGEHDSEKEIDQLKQQLEAARQSSDEWYSKYREVVYKPAKADISPILKKLVAAEKERDTAVKQNDILHRQNYDLRKGDGSVVGKPFMELEKERDELRNELNESERKRFTYQKGVELEGCDNCKEAEKEINKTRDRLRKTQSRNAELNRIRFGLEKERDELSVCNPKHINERFDRLSRIRTLENENEVLRMENDELREKSADAERGRSNLRKKLSDGEDELERLRSRKDKLRDANGKVQSERDELREKLADAERLLQQTSEERDTSEDQCRCKSAEIAELRKELNAIRDDRDHWKANHDELREKLAELETQRNHYLDSYSVEAKKTSKQESKIGSLIDELEHLKSSGQWAVTCGSMSRQHAKIAAHRLGLPTDTPWIYAECDYYAVPLANTKEQKNE